MPAMTNRQRFLSLSSVWLTYLLHMLIITAPLAALESEFMALTQMDEVPQQRGYAFECFLKRWFDTWGLDAVLSKLVQTLVARSPRKRLEMPGRRFCSSRTTGTPQERAARTAGAEA